MFRSLLGTQEFDSRTGQPIASRYPGNACKASVNLVSSHSVLPEPIISISFLTTFLTSVIFIVFEQNFLYISQIRCKYYNLRSFHLFQTSLSSQYFVEYFTIMNFLVMKSHQIFPDPWIQVVSSGYSFLSIFFPEIKRQNFILTIKREYNYSNFSLLTSLLTASLDKPVTEIIVSGQQLIDPTFNSSSCGWISSCEANRHFWLASRMWSVVTMY